MKQPQLLIYRRCMRTSLQEAEPMLGLQLSNKQDNGDSQQGLTDKAEIDLTLHKDDDCL